MTLYRVTDIVWDTDGTDIRHLPTETDIEVEVDEDDDLDEILADALSNQFDFCVQSFKVERD